MQTCCRDLYKLLVLPCDRGADAESSEQRIITVLRSGSQRTRRRLLTPVETCGALMHLLLS